MMTRLGSWQKRMRGATTVELLYMLPVFFMLTFAIIEAAFVYRMRSTLNVASFHAARAGANQHALLQPMQAKLAEGMVPLYMKGARDPSAYATAFASSMRVLGTLVPARNPITIISRRNPPLMSSANSGECKCPGKRLYKLSAPFLMTICAGVAANAKCKHRRRVSANQSSGRQSSQDQHLLVLPPQNARTEPSCQRDRFRHGWARWYFGAASMQSGGRIGWKVLPRRYIPGDCADAKRYRFPE